MDASVARNDAARKVRLNIHSRSYVLSLFCGEELLWQVCLVRVSASQTIPQTQWNPGTQANQE
jgi:hypothetical protein